MTSHAPLGKVVAFGFAFALPTPSDTKAHSWRVSSQKTGITTSLQGAPPLPAL